LVEFLGWAIGLFLLGTTQRRYLLERDSNLRSSIRAAQDRAPSVISF